MSKLDLLTVNDQEGEYPASQYAAGINPKPRPRLEGEVQADICVIGGGFTGVNAALRFAELGYKVVLLEAQRVGFGASGRNGGQIGTGQRVEPDELEKKFGLDRAKALFDLGVAAHDYVLETSQKHGLDIGYQKGVAHLEFDTSGVKAAEKYVQYLEKKFEYEKLELINSENIEGFISSKRYSGGVCDWGAGHADPLALVLGMARAAEKAGAVIYENTRAQSLEPLVKTEHGHVNAKIKILACNGYLGDLHSPTSKYVMPINNFIVATEPLGEERALALLPKNTAIADSKFVVNYFRLSPDFRLLFGGGESYGYKFPKDIISKARKPMLEVFPELEDIKIDYGWGGTLAITMNRLPYIRKEGNLYIAAGYSGHGVALASYMGHLIAQAVHGDEYGFDLMAHLPAVKFPGGDHLRHPLLITAMLWYQLRDKFGF